ncbi:MAG: hypothetical protein K6G61_10575 [Solobacterium sp.]|nr:hypothetical protein [Solobacterium sp.]
MKFIQRFLCAASAFFVLCGTTEIHASSGPITEEEMGTDVAGTQSGAIWFYREASHYWDTVKRKKVGDRTVYCLERTEDVLYGSDYDETDFAWPSDEVRKKCALASYYGYGYNGDRSAERYLGAQHYIWDLLSDDYMLWYSKKDMGMDPMDIDGFMQSPDYLSNLIREKKQMIADLVESASQDMSLSVVSRTDGTFITPHDGVYTVKKGDTVEIQDSRMLMDGYEVTDIRGAKVLDKQNAHITLQITAAAGSSAALTLKTSANGEGGDQLFIYGHTGMQKVMSVPADPVQKSITLKFDIPQDHTEAVILKTDEDGTAVSGAELILNDGSGKTLDEWMSTDAPHTVKDLIIGQKYTLSEKSAPLGFDKADDVTFTAGQVNEIRMKDPRRSVHVAVRKTDEEDDSVLLKGAEFTLYRGSDDRQIAKAETKADGTARFSFAFEGKQDYYIKETKAPAGWHLSDEVIRFTPDSAEYFAEGDKVLTFHMKDRAKKVTASVVKCDSEDHSVLLEGAEFTLYDKDGSKVAEAVSGADGKAVFSFRYTGKNTYTIRETKAPAGYLKTDQEFTFKVDEDSTDDANAFVFTAEDTPDTELSVLKKDRETGKPQGDASFAGAEYTLFDKDTGEEVHVFTVGEDGRSDTLRHITPAHAYILKETKAPEGYAADESVYEPDFAHAKKKGNTLVLTVTSKEDVLKDSFSIHKMISERDHSAFAKPEAGAEFSAVLKKHADRYGSVQEAMKPTDEYADSEYVILVTDEKGDAVSKDLAYGTYLVAQTKGSEGTELLQETFTVEIAAGMEDQASVIDITNVEQQYFLKLVKKDAETGARITYHPALFEVLDESGTPVSQKAGSRSYSVFMTASDEPGDIPAGVFCAFDEEKGTTVLPLQLKAGTYTIREKQAPYGYTAADPVTVTISADTAAAGEDGCAYAEAEILNGRIYGSLSVQKSLEDFEADTELIDRDDLSGVVFELLAAEDIRDPADGSVLLEAGAAFGSYTTDSSGSFTVTQIPAGRYRLKEKAVPAGMILNDMPHEVVIDPDDPEKTGLRLAIENRVTKLEVSKTDAAGSTELPGAQMQVTEEKTGTVIDAWTSSDRPHRISGLRAGTAYVLTETAVPEDGYVQAESVTFTVNADGSLTKQTMVNTRCSVSKKDVAGDELPGAKMKVIDERTGETADEWTSTEEVHLVRGLISGRTYILHEDTAPLGYNRAQDFVFTAGEGNRDTTITVCDTSTEICKESERGPVSGAHLCILDEDGRTVDSWVTDGMPHRTSLDAGRAYFLRETEAPAGFYLHEDIPFTAAENEDQQIVMDEESIVYEIEKTDSEAEPVYDAVLELTDITDPGHPETVLSEAPDGLWHTDGRKIILSGILCAGHRYVLRETAVPAGYYRAEDIQFEVPLYGSGTNRISLLMTDDNTSLRILKTDEDGMPVSGARLSVRTPDGVTVYAFATSGDPEGEDISAYVKGGGTYILHEDSTPFGFAAAPDMAFEVSGRKDRAQTIVMCDMRKAYTVKILKTDAEDGSVLAGAKFALLRADGGTVTDADGRLCEGVTGSDGSLSFRVRFLEDAGGYFVRELSAPEGYRLSEEVFGIPLDAGYDFSSPHIVRVYNRKKPVNTASRSLLQTALVFAVIPLLYVLFRKRR